MSLDPYAAIIDDLKEAARYARQDPDAAVELATRAVGRMDDAWAKERIAWDAIYRLRDNLAVGCRFVRTAPYVLRDYALAAAFEIQCVRRPEKGADET